MRPRTFRARSRSLLAVTALIAATLAAAQAQGDPAAELIRRADAGGADGGLCATINWPPGSGETYVQLLSNAEIGSTKTNRFRNNTQCQVDRVTDVFNGPTGKCVRYTWWACVSGGRCARGEDTDCRQADGSWQRQAK